MRCYCYMHYGISIQHRNYSVKPFRKPLNIDLKVQSPEQGWYMLKPDFRPTTTIIIISSEAKINQTPLHLYENSKAVALT